LHYKAQNLHSQNSKIYKHKPIGNTIKLGSKIIHNIFNNNYKIKKNPNFIINLTIKILNNDYFY